MLDKSELATAGGASEGAEAGPGSVAFHPRFLTTSVRSLASGVAMMVESVDVFKHLLIDVHDTKTAVARALEALEGEYASGSLGAVAFGDRCQSLGDLAASTNKAQHAVLATLSRRLSGSIDEIRRVADVLSAAGMEEARDRFLRRDAELVQWLAALPRVETDADADPGDIGVLLDLKDLVCDVAQTYGVPDGGRQLDIDVRSTAASGPVDIVADATWLRFILGTLLSNLSASALADTTVCLQISSSDNQRVELNVRANIESRVVAEGGIMLPLLGQADPLFRSVGVVSRLGEKIVQGLIGLNGGSLSCFYDEPHEVATCFSFTVPCEQ